MKRAFGKWAQLAGMAALWLGVALLVFRVVLPEGAVLMSTDDSVGSLANRKRAMENSVVHPWEQTLWGMPHQSSIRPGFFVERMMSTDAFANWFHAMCLGGAAWWLMLYLLGKGLRCPSAVFGGMVAFWTGTNLTLTYAGHAGKYAILFFMSMAVWALGKWSTTKRGAWAVVAGGAVGAMFLEQGDVALFCALCLLPVALAEWYTAWGRTWKGGVRRWLGSIVPALAAAGLMVAGTTLSTVHSGVTASTEAMGKAEKWDYVTQWSQPPDESFDFVAPGWMGWRSGDAEGPYRGKTGQSAEWVTTRQGFRNFRLESVYIGGLPLVLALVGIWKLRRGRNNRDGIGGVTWRGVALVWTWTGVVALVLAFGKYTPFYYILAAVPGFSEIRNPNKFLHFFQMAWGVLAALGLDTVLCTHDIGQTQNCRCQKSRNVRRATGDEGGRKADNDWRRKVMWGCWIVASLIAVAWGVTWTDMPGAGGHWMTEGWSAVEGLAIARNRAFALLWLAVSCGVAGAVFWGVVAACHRGVARFKMLVAWLPMAFVAVEAAFVLGPHYIQSMPKGYISENELTHYLDSELGASRLAVAPGDQGGLYNFWLTFLFPYHGITSVNVTQLPRPPADYMAFWNGVRDPVRQWKLAGVSHILAHGNTVAAMMHNPVWAGQLEPCWAFQPKDDGEGGVTTPSIEPSAYGVSAEFVLQFKKRPPRVAVVKKWRKTSDEEALALLGDVSREPFDEVLLGDETNGVDDGGTAGYETVEEFETLKSGLFKFRVKTDNPAVLRVAERWMSGWRATLNGKPAQTLRCDFMFTGVWIPGPGEWNVCLVYAPREPGVVLQGVGLLLGLGGLLMAIVGGLLRNEINGATA